MQNARIAIGSFFFRYRNVAFPTILVALFVSRPPSSEVFGSERLAEASSYLALAIMVAGLIVRASVIGYAYVKRGGREKRVYARDLVTGGMFGVCRNPLYVGNMLNCIAIFMMHGNWRVFVTGVALYGFIYSCIVAAEEDYLRRSFGAAYEAYCADVQRWIPNLRNLRRATEGMRFDLKRVIWKDSGTFASTLSLFAAAALYKEVFSPRGFVLTPQIVILSAAAIACILLAGTVSLRKRQLAREKRGFAPVPEYSEGGADPSG